MSPSSPGLAVRILIVAACLVVMLLSIQVLLRDDGRASRVVRPAQAHAAQPRR